MSRKIIIITRDTDPNYSDPNNPLGKMIVEGKGISIPKKESYLASFQYLSKYKTPELKGGYSTTEIAENYDVEIDDNDSVKWLNGEIKDLKIPYEIVNLLDKVRIILNDEKLYEKITMDNGDIVYLLYWNLLVENEFKVWQCIPLICKDCEIDMNVTIKEIPDRHVLYIHDDEWGKEGNWLLMKNSEPKGSDKEYILKSLKDYFQYIATFQHVDFVGSYFNNILNCRFGEDSIADKLGELEDNVSFTDFIQLKQEMIKKLQEWKK